ncbi:hypothetical protein BD626DRAFT_367903, partial [Schizophyllum amplum]
MDTSWSVIQHDGHSTVADHSSVAFHHYPFDTMGAIELHIPYHYVIANTARKLRTRYDTLPKAALLASDFPSISSMLLSSLAFVWEIYDVWMRADPDPNWKKKPQ